MNGTPTAKGEERNKTPPEWFIRRGSEGNTHSNNLLQMCLAHCNTSSPMVKDIDVIK